MDWLNGLAHGGALDRIAAAYPDAPRPWLDLSTGVNPHAYRDFEISNEVLWNLPSETQFAACRTAMADAWGAVPDAVCPVPGTETVIRHLPRLISAERVGMAAFSYADHLEAWQGAGASVLRSEDPCRLSSQVDVLVIVNPDNPTGRRYRREELLMTYETLRERGGTLIVDEAYMDTAPEHSLVDCVGRPGLIVLRSLGKFYGLAGLRLGALLGETKVLERWRAFAGHWPVSSLALDLGAQIYRDIDWADSMRSRLATESAEFRQDLKGAGFEILGHSDLFTLMRVSDAELTWRRLAEAGVYVRWWPGKSECLRLGLPRDEVQKARVIKALKQTT